MKAVAIFACEVKGGSLKKIEHYPIKPYAYCLYVEADQPHDREFISEHKTVEDAFHAAEEIDGVERIFISEIALTHADNMSFVENSPIDVIIRKEKVSPMYVAIHPCFEENGEVTKLLQDGPDTPNLFTVYSIHPDLGIEIALSDHETMTEAANFTAALPEGTTIEMTSYGMSLLLAENFTR